MYLKKPKQSFLYHFLYNSAIENIVKAMSIKLLFIAITILLTLSTLMTWPSFPEIAKEPFEQSRIYIIIILIGCAFLSLLGKFYILTGINLLLVATHMYVVLQAYPLVKKHTEICSDETQSLSVLSHNIYYKNLNYNAIAKNILNQNADIVMLQEAKKPFLEQTYDTLSQTYPFIHPDIKNGKSTKAAIFSKYPITEVTTPALPLSKVRISHAKIEVDVQVINVISIHAISPKGQKTIELRNRTINDLANYAQNLRYNDEAVIIAGDFNNAPWYPQMRALQKQGDLKGNPHLLNYFGTWPEWGKGIIAFPIDHIFYSRHFTNISYKKVSNSAGSDHFPVLAQFKLCK